MESIALYFVAATLGGMIFFALGIAPAVFKSLSSQDAGAFLRVLFPRYYIGLIIGSAAAGIFFLKSAAVASIICFSIAISTLWVRQSLVPRINQLRDAELAGDKIAGSRFAKMHRLSVGINMIQLIGLLGLVILY